MDRLEHANLRFDGLREEGALSTLAFIVRAKAASAPARESISIPYRLFVRMRPGISAGA